MQDPAAIVQAQLAAYNAHDIPALLACYAEQAQQLEWPGRLLAHGRAAIGARMRARLAESPGLHARLIQRCVAGDLVIDQEEISGGAATRWLVALYRVEGGLIREAQFRFQSGP